MECVDVLEVAKKIISKTDGEQGDTISNLKLQKLLYYMQGYHLAFFDTPLFCDEIVAWKYGPVVEKVYDEYEKYGKNALPVQEYESEYNIESLTEEQENLIYSVYKEYNQFSATALVEMTHNEMPGDTTELKSVISQDKLKEFFKTMVIEEDNGEKDSKTQKGNTSGNTTN